MKKKLFPLFVAILFAAYCLVGNNIEHIVDLYKVKDDKPSQVQMETFESKSREKCFYYYNKLPDTDKGAYISLYYNFMEYDDSIYVESTESDINNIIVAVLYDNPEIFWVDNQYEYSTNNKRSMIIPKYRFTAEEAREMQNDSEIKIKEIMATVNSFKTDYEKELYIHDYVINNTEYDMSTLGNMGDTVYNTLVVGKAICEGYAKTMQILLDKAGIYNYLVTGEGENADGEMEQHMWNIVNIDGENYHLDSTWDDLKDTKNIGYFYFNVTDEYISRDHKNISPTGNNCVSDKANYFVKNNSVVNDYNGFSSHVNRSVKILSSGSNEVVFYFTDRNDYDRALRDLKNDKGFFRYVSAVVDKSGKNYRKDNVDYVTIDTHNYLSIVFKEG